MKVELVQSACPASTGNYDIVSGGGASSPNNDLVGAMFWSVNTSTDDNNIAANRFSFGATDLASNLCIAQGAQDATVGAGNRSMLSNTNCVFTANGVGGQANPIASFNPANVGAISNGIRLTTTVVTSGRLLNTLLISGSDVAMKVGTQYAATGGATSFVITHGLGGTPDVIIIFASLDVPSGTNEVDGKGFAIGFWERAGGSSVGTTYAATTGSNPPVQSCFTNSGGSGSVVEVINAAGSSLGDTRVSAVGSTTFTLTDFLGDPGINVMYGWIALRGTASQMFSGTNFASLPTGTGNQALISGLSGKPQVYIALPTRTTVLGLTTGDAAGSYGCSVGCSTDGSTTFQGCNPQTFQSVTVGNASVAKHRISITKGLEELLNTGLPDAVATVSTWDSGGVTLNYSAGASGSFICPVLAFGLPASGGSGKHGTLSMMGVGQ